MISKKIICRSVVSKISILQDNLYGTADISFEISKLAINESFFYRYVDKPIFYFYSSFFELPVSPSTKIASTRQILLLNNQIITDPSDAPREILACECHVHSYLIRGLVFTCSSLVRGFMLCLEGEMFWHRFEKPLLKHKYTAPTQPLDPTQHTPSAISMDVASCTLVGIT